MNLDRLQQACHSYLIDNLTADPAHDISHVQRVVENTLRLTSEAGGNENVTLPAAWLHDCVSIPKDSPLRNQASRISADEAIKFLQSQNYPPELLDQVHHAISAHSFSANIKTRTLEARIVQDADRLEALGAIGIARCFLTGGSMGSQLYERDDPFAENRELDDRQYTIDHFYSKLLGLADTMKTSAGKAEALKRTKFMQGFIQQFSSEIGHPIIKTTGTADQLV